MEKAFKMDDFVLITGIKKKWFLQLVQETKEHAAAKGKLGNSSKRYNISKLTLSGRKWNEILFFTLFSMKQYWIEFLDFFIFNIPQATAKRWKEFGFSILHDWAKKQITYPPKEERKLNKYMFLEEYEVPLVIDCSEQKIVQSIFVDTENKSFSGKYMDHTLTLLVGVHPVTGRVLLVSKTEFGCKTDQQIFNSIDWELFITEVEFILADKGFNAPCILRKFRKKKNGEKTERMRLINKEVDRRRIIVENAFGWVKKFRICSDKLRYKTKNPQHLLERHNRIWTIAFGLLNRFSALRTVHDYESKSIQ